MHLRTALCLLLPTATLPAQTAVTPAGRTSLEGSSYTHFPLGRHDARFQFLYGDLPAGMVLNGHAYRRDAIGMRGQVEGFVADLEVTLSLSANTPLTASTIFANNVGVAPVAVLPRTTLSFPPTHRPALDPSPTFDLIVPYQVPFVMPTGSATLCLDTTMYGNASAAGANRNLSIYLDAHELHNNGTNEQPGFRTGPGGCPAPGRSTASFANLSLWNLVSASQIDVSIRNGVADDGTLLAHAFVSLGTAVVHWPWHNRPTCVQQSSTEIWFALPGNMTASGSYDGSLTGLPTLPPGYRLWCQAGSVHLGSAALSFADLSGVVTPPPAVAPLPAVRIAASNNRLAGIGAISNSVPITQFF